MKKNIIIILAVIAFILVLVLAFSGRREAPMPEPEESEPEAGETIDETEVVTVELFEQNDSGQFGIAFIETIDGRAFVFVQVGPELEGALQPAHIHFNSCADIVGVRYPLNPVENGVSETLLDVTIEQIMGELPLAITVHKSFEEAVAYVACGDINR